MLATFGFVNGRSIWQILQQTVADVSNLSVSASMPPGLPMASLLTYCAATSYPSAGSALGVIFMLTKIGCSDRA